MNRCMICCVCGCFAAVVANPSGVAAQTVAAQTVQSGELVLGRGPIHEAFAEVISFDPIPGVVAPRKPADPIRELPPTARPAGSRVRWIPGYWAWDHERNDFLWVSGGWRNAPPNHRWIPGYWAPVSNGYRWISGFWIPESDSEISYLPTPPASVEEGPTSQPPSPDHFWIPGCWVWRNATYVWRPGYWWRATPGWIWIPAHFRHTPRGSVYVAGYWDYDLSRRGHLYAPVYYTRPVYFEAGYYYRPTSLVELGLLTASLFIRPDHQHYYFGDYYGPRYRGYHPWYGYGAGQRGFDPIFSYYVWQHRNDNDWRNRVEREYQRRRDQPNLRPPELARPRDGRDGLGNQAARPLVRPLADAAPDVGAGESRDQRVTDSNRERMDQMRQLRRDRRDAEQPANPAGPQGDRGRAPSAVELPKGNQQVDPPRSSTPSAEIPRWRVPERQTPVDRKRGTLERSQNQPRSSAPKQNPNPGSKNRGRN